MDKLINKSITTQFVDLYVTNYMIFVPSCAISISQSFNQSLCSLQSAKCKLFVSISSCD